MTDLDVAIVGAGIAGLTAAHELRRAGRSVRVFESAGHIGGRMASHRHDGYTMDTGAEQIPSRGYAASWELLARLGVPRDEVPLIPAAIALWRDGRPRPGVAEPRGLLTGAGLSPRARLELLRFLAAARRCDPDHPESGPLGLATLAELDFGRELHDQLLQPVSGCFFGWDPARSAAAPFAALLNAVGPRTTWRTYADGMDTLARRLALGLAIELGTEVREVVTEAGFARLRTATGSFTARSVLLCVPGPLARRLHVNPAPEAREFLAAAGFTPMLKVSCLLDRPLGPTGIYALLVPEVADSALAGILVDHHKHPGRAPHGRGLLSLIAAPHLVPDLLGASDDEVATRLLRAAEPFVPGVRAATTRTFVHRFRHGLPEVTPRALALRAGFAARPAGPVDYAGDWVACRPSSEGAVRSAAIAAARVLSTVERIREPV